MSDIAKFTLCVLWESELRQAAKLLQVCFDADKGDPDLGDKMSHALTSAHVALVGLTDDKVVCMVGSDQIRKARGAPT